MLVAKEFLPMVFIDPGTYILCILCYSSSKMFGRNNADDEELCIIDSKIKSLRQIPLRPQLKVGIRFIFFEQLSHCLSLKPLSVFAIDSLVCCLTGAICFSCCFKFCSLLCSFTGN